MYSKFEYVNNESDTVDFMGAIAPTGFFALTNVMFEINGRSTERPKMEANGSWATFTYYDKLLLHLEGAIVAGTPEDYNVFKQAAVNKLMVPPTVLQDERTQGAMVFRLLGFNEDYSIPGVVETPPITPAEVGTAPSASPFRMVFKAFRPYAYGVTSEQYYWVT